MRGAILIVDDEETLRFTFQSLLSAEGHQVRTASDFREAVEALDQESFDLVLADIVLPGRSGIDVLEEVKARGLSCPVVMITGYPTVDTAAQAVRLGAFDYLPKPVRRDHLLRAVNQALRHKELMDRQSVLEAESHRYRSHLEAIFRSVHDGIITVDPQQVVTEANQAAERICGFARERLLGLPFDQSLAGCAKFCGRALEQTLTKRTPVIDQHLECDNASGEHRSVTVNTTPLLDRDGDFLGAVLLLRDVTRLAELEKELDQRRRFHKLVGQSPQMQEVYRLLEDLAEFEASVLILGESGTGKELVAEAIHFLGPRREKPMVKVNCSALAENLLESELFGHVRGAFTGAVKDKPGRFELADGGTILLDEIGDLSPAIQLKLLRVLQEKEIERVGEARTRKVDVRIITATNHDLAQLVAQGRFREDLYYRLKVVEVKLPPLRQRREDISLLSEHFIAKFNQRYHKNVQGGTPDFSQALLRYHWPGNVRELEHAIEHSFVLCRGGLLTETDLPPEIRSNPSGEAPLEQGQALDEREELLQVLQAVKWNKAAAARRMGISRQTLYRKLSKHQVG